MNTTPNLQIHQDINKINQQFIKLQKIISTQQKYEWICTVGVDVKRFLFWVNSFEGH